MALQPERSQKVMSGFDGKALLRDLDFKFENQDKLLNYMMQQIQSMEKQQMDI